MSAVKVLASITVLLFVLGLVHTNNDCSNHWLLEEKTSEKRPTEWDPLPEKDVDKRAATKNVFHRILYL